MRYRPLGKTGISVSEIGFGSWGIGGLSKGATSYGDTDDAQSLRAVARAVEIGISFFDTSDLYGYGHSEDLLGQAFSGIRQKMVIASKVGFLEHLGPQDFSAGHIRRSLEGSLKRLKTDYLDLYQLHSPDILEMEKNPEALNTLRALKKEGKIRAYGVSVRAPGDGVAAVRLGFESVQVNFNMTDQRAVESGLMDAAGKAGTAVIGRTPLCFGFLTGAYTPNTTFDKRDHRSAWTKEQIELWANASAKFKAAFDTSVKQTEAQAALRYCLSYPAVSAVIPGILKPSEAEENAAASDLGPLSKNEVTQIEQAYRDNSFFLGKRSQKLEVVS